MNGSPSSIVMFGLGNGTFDGSPSLMITRGLGVGAELNRAYPTDGTFTRQETVGVFIRQDTSGTFARIT